MNNYKKFEQLIEEYGLSAEEVLKLLTDWHGTQILSDDFMENLRECEGIY